MNPSQPRSSRIVAFSLLGLVSACSPQPPEPQSPGAQSPEAPERLDATESQPYEQEQSAPAADSPAAPEPAAAAKPATGGASEEKAPHDALPSKRKSDEGRAAGAAPAPPITAADDELSRSQPAIAGLDLQSALQLIESNAKALESSVSSGAPDCPGAEGYRKAVCELAERICALENELPSTTRDRHCGDSRARCGSASARYRAVCGD
jgi:hypothetical protein